MGRTSRQKFAEQERHPQHQSIFDEVDRELRRSRRRSIFPYLVIGIAATLILAIVGGIAYSSWVLGGGYG
jgi:hypothetical protein